MSEKIEGHYAAFYKGFTATYIGGCIYWNQDKNDSKIFWTSRWWMYEDVKEIIVDFYKVTKDEDLDLTIPRKKIKLDFPGKILLGQVLKGSLKMVSM